jgi:hypothetical protein
MGLFSQLQAVTGECGLQMSRSTVKGCTAAHTYRPALLLCALLPCFTPSIQASRLPDQPEPARQRGQKGRVNLGGYVGVNKTPVGGAACGRTWRCPAARRRQLMREKKPIQQHSRRRACGRSSVASTLPTQCHTPCKKASVRFISDPQTPFDLYAYSPSNQRRNDGRKDHWLAWASTQRNVAYQ